MNKNLFSKEKIFIAGANGMVGSAIKRALNKYEYNNLSNKSQILTPNRSELDLTNYYSLEKWFMKNKPTIVIIAAAKVGGIYANNNEPACFILENLKIQTNLIELSWKYNVKTLLFLGSSCIYPKLSKQPIKEEYLMTNSLEKTNEYYALAKIAGIKLCQALKIQHKFNTICLMPTNLYGKGDNYHALNSHVIPGLIKKFHNGKENNLPYVSCWGSGTPLREFLYVDDLADACIFILKRWNMDIEKVPLDENGNEIFLLNIGSEFEISIKELANKISKKIGYTGKIIWNEDMPDGTPRKKLDTSKMEYLGWKAKTDLDNGLKLTLSHYYEEILCNKLRE